ncbi:hypothetical protein ADL01_15015 [Streptomyces sp. NRRL WC-3618]|uniref:hypothetical protein n=1 Tax=Streptomyces sp. NRRL WC-3618 TaxID=1519490 RepID=UPI0006AE99B9|nr:hypothetical protein [Streptomyces sp. NRRL WC-3618]KOV78627.1 hypothetical protein ADL01_15015 [Streptomyces sp. NRRL WC-3618]
MPQIEPSVLTALMAAAKDAVSNAAAAFSLAAMDVGSSTAVEQRDALVAALRRRPSEVLKARTEPREAPPIPPTTPAQLEIWSLYADHVDDPLLRGHLHHLLLDAGHGRRPDHVRGAASGYLDAVQLLLAAQDGHGLLRAARCLKRAGELSLKFKQHAVRERATKDAVALAERLLAGAEDEGRPLLVVLETLQTLECDVADLAERAADLFARDVDVRLGFLDALRKDAVPSRHTEIDAAVVHTLLDAADTADAGHRRLYFLTEAATQAQKRGLPDLRARAEMALQQTTPEWTSIRTEGTIPRALIAGQQARVDAAEDLRTALWLTVQDIHPAMRAQAEAEADGALEGLLRIPRSRINPAGPVFVRPPVEADDDLAVAMQVRGLGLFGILTAIQLDRIHERFRPDEFEMTAALAHEAVLPEPRARTLAQAFCYYWLEEFDAAACVALPQVEQILRELLRSRVPVVSVVWGPSPGGVDLLGKLLQSMPEAGYPADWSRALELLLVDPDRGMNLRNDILHGLADTPSKHHVVLILQAALYLLSHAHGQRMTPDPTA